MSIRAPWQTSSTTEANRPVNRPAIPVASEEASKSRELTKEPDLETMGFAGFAAMVAATFKRLDQHFAKIAPQRFFIPVQGQNQFVSRGKSGVVRTIVNNTPQDIFVSLSISTANDPLYTGIVKAYNNPPSYLFIPFKDNLFCLLAYPAGNPQGGFPGGLLVTGEFEG